MVIGSVSSPVLELKPGFLSFSIIEAKFFGNHLVYYRFAGRILGRALFDGRVIKGHLVRTLYKHILAWPITYEDLEAQDEMFFQSLKRLMRMDDFDLSSTYLNFSVTHNCGGEMRPIDLVENGESKMVNSENLPEYLESIFRYRLIDRILPHLTEFLLGFYDVVPEPLLAVFDASELELLLCGLPRIDVDDWKEHTVYGGCFAECGERHQVVCWFWDVVIEFDDEMRARLLQFATGSSSVPAGGFALLSGGDDGISKPFTLEGVDVRVCFYPKAHTCFNRIDLPNYFSRDELRERLIVSITTSCVGFDAEEIMF
jgi:E3 ubiquitin-protein ligase NEDD4